MENTYKIIAVLVLVIVFLLWKPKANRKDLIVYGSKKCGWTVKQLDYNNEKGISHVFVDCDKRKCPDFVKGFPTLQTKDGKVVSGFTKL